MNLIGLIIFVLFVWFGIKVAIRLYNFYRIAKQAQNSFKSQTFNQKSYTNPSSKSRNKKTNSRMVECSKCGVYVPEDESFLANGKSFCSKEHIS